MKEYTRTVSHRILALTKKLSLHNQARQHGSYKTQSINTSIANTLHNIGQYNPHSGSFHINNNIARILTSHDPLLHNVYQCGKGGRWGGAGVTLLINYHVGVCSAEPLQDEIKGTGRYRSSAADWEWCTRHSARRPPPTSPHRRENRISAQSSIPSTRKRITEIVKSCFLKTTSTLESGNYPPPQPAVKFPTHSRDCTTYGLKISDGGG
eukprot:6203575-Pleurochrysis_carterae.AAC.1